MISKCDYIPDCLMRKVVLLDHTTCGHGSMCSSEKQASKNARIVVEKAVDDTDEGAILYASLIKIYSVKDSCSPAFSTMGGVIYMDGKSYGLTTAHAIRAVGYQRQQAPQVSSTLSQRHLYLSHIDFL